MTYDSAPWLGDLTSFQRRSVEHVVEQFYGSAHASRFLVADETGLGKTRVARGVIARAIEKLQDVDDVQRIDVVYVCANADLARQNIRRLNVTGQDEIPFASRLTLLGKHSNRLNQHSGPGKGVNLISFTPGTSFDPGNRLGQAPERAMIARALTDLYDLDGHQRRALCVLLRGTVSSPEAFRDNYLGPLEAELGIAGIDPSVLTEFGDRLERGGDNSLRARVRHLLDDINRKRYVPLELRENTYQVVSELRAALAVSSVETLEPDLVILDEFQRFRHLLSRDNPGGELAHHLFEFKAAKVLLLSATPYKPFTLAEESDDDHATDLFNTLAFLAEGRDDVDVDAIRTGLGAYRESVLSAEIRPEVLDEIRCNLLKLMCRAERPPDSSMTREHVESASDLRPSELADFATLQRIAETIAHPQDRSLVTAEYWKSAPYFLTFSDGYQLGRRLQDAEPTPALGALLARSQHIRSAALQKFEPVDAGNPRMRILAAETVDRDWWRLLWMPPSLPYLQPTGPYASPDAADMTKRLVFSSWAATPSSVASILSYEAERRMVEGSSYYTEYTAEARKKIARRFTYSVTDDRPQNMAALLIHWPMPGLATELDPLSWVASAQGQLLPRDAALGRAREVIAARLRRTAGGRTDETTSTVESEDRHWRTVFGWADSWPDDIDDQALAQALAGNQPDSDAEEIGLGGLLRHIGAARSAQATPRASTDDETIEILAHVGLFSPANIAYRALRRLAGRSGPVSEWALFRSAAVLANGVRSLFNRPDVIQLIDRVGDDSLHYWRKVLSYIAMGNLEAVLDEYLHQLLADRSGEAPTADLIAEVAGEAAAALSLRSPTLRASDPSEPGGALAFSARFALRYGGRDQNAEDVRQPEVRRAFNSPFWPFVLASTSVGQEGIDFHWWCHAVFHWNVPSNPVDFEQREGRVDRYRGHAVRKNITAAHAAAALSVADGNPWDRLYELANDHQDEFGDFSPGWVYPGPHHIERHVAPFAFSTDLERYERMKRDVARYRLTFGQPRQEDMLNLMERRSVQADRESLQQFRIDLAP